MVSTPSPSRIAILTGPTACGKTSMAIELVRQAQHQGVSIQLINADSLQMIRGFTVGTAKPTATELRVAPHQLLDVFDPHDSCTAGDFVRLARQCIHENDQKGMRSLIVGGTGFYIKALLTELWPAAPTQAPSPEFNPADFDRFVQLDPDTAYKVGPNDHYRIKRSLQIMEKTGKKISELSFTPAPDADRYQLFLLDHKALDERIQKRTEQMLQDGLIEETKTLLKTHPNSRALESVGYKQVVQSLRGEKPQGRKIREGLAGLSDEITLATRQLVKSQRTWMRGQYKPFEKHAFILPEEQASCLSALGKLYGL